MMCVLFTDTFACQFSTSRIDNACNLISHFWMTVSETDSAKMARNIFHQCSWYQRMATIAEEVGQCAYANTFNRTFRGRLCRLASSCISVKRELLFPSLFVVASLCLSTLVFARRIPLSLALHRRNQ